MTKKQALESFTLEILPYVIMRYGKDDIAAHKRAWNNYTDQLCSETLITAKQCESWNDYL